VKAQFEQNKLPGKTKYSGRRRPMTRKSGFKSHPETTGGEFNIADIPACKLKAGQTYELEIDFPRQRPGEFVGFGGWFCSDGPLDIQLQPEIQTRLFSKIYPHPNWSKIGSIWMCKEPISRLLIAFTAQKDCFFATYEFRAGIVTHRHLSEGRQELLGNMYQFAPEALFISHPADVQESRAIYSLRDFTLHLKSCNRCGRFLPINIVDERATLSFSNHCVANRPCKHRGFGLLTHVGNATQLQLEYGFQLECRFCKKFEVNAALNPQRTPAQMKEDGARRRAFELLLAELQGESYQLSYRHKHGRELTDDIFEKFKRCCFKCELPFRSPNEMHLDHTRPLALLWPLDHTATALCCNCNPEKRDRSPSEFYNATELKKLAHLTGIPLGELKKPVPNLAAVRLLQSRLDWFFDTFLKKPEMLEERDGKIAGDLLVKALNKALNKCPGGAPFDVQKQYETRR
jgi:hypothetical protein